MAVKGDTERRHQESEGDGRSQKERRRERERERMERGPHYSPAAEPRSSARRDSSGTAGRDETSGGFRRNVDGVAGREMDRDRFREVDEADGRKNAQELDRWTPHDAESSGALRFKDSDRMSDEHRRHDKKRQGRQERTVQSDGGRLNNDVAPDSDVDRVRYRDKEDDRKREGFLQESSLSEKYKTKDSHSRKEELHQSDKAKRDHAGLDKSMEDVQNIEEVRYPEKNKHDSKKGSYLRERERYDDRRSSKEIYEERHRGRRSEENYSHERGRYRGVERDHFEDEKHENASRKGHGRKEEDGLRENISQVDRKKTESMSAHTDREDGRQRHEHKQKVTEKDSLRDGSDPSARLDNGEIAKVDKISTTVRAGNGKEPSSKGESGGNEKVLGKSGGVYIPPFKLAQMLKDVKDKSSLDYQRMTWDALRKSINGLVNKVNASNIKNILPELFSENLIRGRGLFARSCMKSQMASPAFTHVFAALVAVVNTKFPELGELLLKRIILQLRRAFKRNDKPVLLAVVKFVAHLVNQQVAHEILALELLTILLDSPTDDSVEVAVGFVKECGAHLQEVSPQGLHGIFERFRGILHEGEIDKRVQFMIEGLFAIRKANFQGHPAVLPDLDLVEQEDQITHELTLDEDLDQEIGLDIFKPDPSFLDSEKKYEDIKKEILGEESDDDAGGAEDESAEDSEEDEDEESEDEKKMTIHDETETNLVNLRRTIYLTIMSSVDFEEAGHKLMKIKLEPGQEMELCVMLLECCSQERTYLRYYGLLGQRFCMINRVFQENFDECFVKQYSMIHRLETNKLRNVAKFFAHLLGTDALPWQVLAYIRLTEEDTTSSSRIFIKILFQELSEHLGLRKLNERLNDPLVQESFDGIFPKDNPKNTRFAINFFTSIGLGGITDSLREYLKNMPRLIMQQQKPIESENDDTGSSDASSNESTSESETESTDTDSIDVDSNSDSESDGKDSKPKKKRRKQ